MTRVASCSLTASKSFPAAGPDVHVTSLGVVIVDAHHCVVAVGVVAVAHRFTGLAPHRVTEYKHGRSDSLLDPAPREERTTERAIRRASINL
jgi:hypothetical protein